MVDPEGVENKEYIGDGAYVGTFLGDVVLWTSDGIEVQHTICLEPVVLRAFENWLEKIRKSHGE